MNAKVFDKLGPELQDAVLESAYWTQALIQGANEAALINTVGFSDPQMPDTVFANNNVRPAFLSTEELEKAEKMCSPQYVPEPWEEWRERLNDWAGGVDTYTEMSKIAREIPVGTLAENVEPRRWWRS